MDYPVTTTDAGINAMFFHVKLKFQLMDRVANVFKSIFCNRKNRY